MGYTLPAPDCYDTRECFAMRFVHGGFRVCNALTETYRENGKCPFCKRRKEDRNDVHEDRDKERAE